MQDVMNYKGRIGLLRALKEGNDSEVEWTIPDVDTLSNEEDARYAPRCPFEFHGQFWFLEMLPNSGRNNIDLCLCAPIYTGPPITVDVTVSLRTVTGEKVLERQKVGVFSKTKYQHFIVRLLTRQEYQRRKSEFLSSSGSLTLICTLKKSNESASDGATPGCSYIKTNIDDDTLPPYKKKRVDKPLKCADCSADIDLQNFYEDENTSENDEASLSEDLKEMLLNGLHHDLILRVGEKEFKAHQDMLKSRSPVFNIMLSQDMKEKSSGVVDITDCDPQVMEQFLCYTYTGKVDSLDESNMLELYHVADKYQVKGLKRKCCVFIKKSLSVTNICDVIQFATIHTDSGLLEYATEYFIDNALEVVRTVQWKSLMKTDPDTANELIIKGFERSPWQMHELESE